MTAIAQPTVTNTPSLTTDQTYALSEVLHYIADPAPKSPFFVLSGFSGTGKTFLMQEVIRRSSLATRTRFAFTAPTNKAAKVLRSITGAASTIFVLLGLRIEKNGELKELVGGDNPVNLDDYDVIFLDEASMIGSKLFSRLASVCEAHRVKVVFMGDPAQLPPVGEIESLVWREPLSASLTQVMRHDNQILKLVTAIRGNMNSPAPCIDIKSDNSSDEGVWKVTKPAFKERIYSAAIDGAFADSSLAKVIAWRNVRVAEYNDLIRKALFGAEAEPGTYLPGDRIIATAPCKRGEEHLLSTDDEAIVEGTLVSTHPLHPKYKVYELKCRTETGRTIRLMVVHPVSVREYEADCEALAHSARSNPREWKKFWNLKELFHDIKYGYAITAHRSQGSTYETVFVDYQDILLNRNRKEAFQCLYVACSRPTTRLILA